MAEVKLHPLENGTEPVPVAAEPVPGSIVARLRAQAKAQRAAKQTDILVGGEFKTLYIRYRTLPPGEMDKFAAQRQGIRNVADISATSVTMDMMARACVCLVDKYDGEETVLEDEGGPVRLEDRLAYLLDLRSPTEPKLTSHDVITRVFGNNGPMIVTHGDRLANWMSDPTQQEAPSPGEA